MPARISLGDIEIDVVKKDIKNIHLSVHPPGGRVRIAAPLHMKLDTIRVFALSKLAWIKQQQAKLRRQVRETPREYADRESHYLWGKRYLLKVMEQEAAPKVALRSREMRLQIRPGTLASKREAIMEQWYREQLKAAIPPLLARWSPIMGVSVDRFFVQRMKTQWGSCTPARRWIRLNTELVKKPRECLEYILVHELAHLIEPTHNARFIALMDGFMPNWPQRRDQLNALPVRHEEWEY
jgi:predicted metal-dependent hydrolase